ncbi:hypothetical protein GCM10010282_66240 [Streptomyces roseolus]|nr:hypothetical protein GCM10010282_66240 [Streptomyces roseolus]
MDRWRWSCPRGESGHQQGTGAWGFLGCEGAAVGGGQAPDDREAEASAAGAAGAGFVEAGKSVEDAGPVSGRYAGAIVPNGQDELGSGAADEGAAGALPYGEGLPAPGPGSSEGRPVPP